MNSTVPNTIIGLIAAISAPLFMTIGFLIWDIEWKKAGGSAFALNMFKCNLASLAFLIMCGIVGFATGNISGDEDNNIASFTDNLMTEDGQYSVFTVQNVGFLIISSFIGIVIGDSAWLEALRLLGATRVLVVDTLKPFVAAGLGRWILKEQLHPLIFVGMVLTIFGVLLVSLEKEKGHRDLSHEHSPESINVDKKEDYESISESVEETDGKRISSLTATHKNEKSEESCCFEFQSKSVMVRGYFFAVLNVSLDSYGSILTKQFGQGMTTWAINLIRFGFAGVFLVMLSLSCILRSKVCPAKEPKSTTQDPSTIEDPSSSSVTNNESANEVPWFFLPNMKFQQWLKIAMGVAFVTFICPALSNYALFQIAIALAVTLFSLTPIYALILEWVLKGKRPSTRAAIGAIFAVSGVIVLGFEGVD